MISCILVDDEPLALRLLQSYAGRIDDVEITGAYTSPVEALQRIEAGGVQLAFLDIQMPGMDGIELARVARQHGTRVIFITAYRDFAVDGFRVAALDYLLKPVNFSEFADAVGRFRALEPTTKASQGTETVPDTIMVKSDYRTIPVRVSDVVYIEGLKDYVKIYLAGRDRPIITQMSLKALESALPHEGFMRVHRSFIVALGRVTAFGRTQIKTGPAVIPIGETYRAKVLDELTLRKN